MGHNFNCRSAQQQRHLAKRAQKVDANHFFNRLTDPRMLETVEAQLPEHREHQFPPTLTLAMFLGQIMSADGSCHTFGRRLRAAGVSYEDRQDLLGHKSGRITTLLGGRAGEPD